jgi:Uma2 family endonuclease
LANVSWEGYEKLLDEIGDSAVRMTYDSGYLEFELPTELHERLTELVGSLVEAALEAADIDFQPLGSTTWRREPRAKGLEADQCFYIQSLPLIQGKSEIDLEQDPPPDLGIETEVTSPLLDKMAVYAGLGVPELWRVSERGDVQVLKLSAARKYEPAERSEALPKLDGAILSRFAKMLQPLGPMPHSRVIKQFRQWLAEQAN